MIRIFPLWGFDNGRVTIFTRGETQEQAWEYVKDHPAWERGETVAFLQSLPTTTAKIYDNNHAPGWLYRPMYWLQKKEEQERFRNAPKLNDAIAAVVAKLKMKGALRTV